MKKNILLALYSWPIYTLNINSPFCPPCLSVRPDRQADRQAGKTTDKQTHKYTGAQTDKQFDRQTDR